MECYGITNGSSPPFDRNQSSQRSSQQYMFSEDRISSTSEVHPTSSFNSSFIPSFELESHPEASRFTVQVPLFSRNADDEDDSIYRHNRNTEGRFPKIWDFTSNQRKNANSQMETIFYSNDPSVINSFNDTVNRSILQQFRQYIRNKYLGLRCWMLRRRQEWEDGNLFSLTSSSWDDRNAHPYCKPQCLRVGWALFVLVLLSCILLQLCHMKSLSVTRLTRPLLPTESKILPIPTVVDGLMKHHSNFIDIYVNPLNSKTLLFGFNKTLLLNPDRNMILFSSIFRRGAINLDPPAIAFTPSSDDIIIIFALSSDSQFVEVRQIPEGLRSSHPVFQAQIDLNIWTGSLFTLPVTGQSTDQLVADAHPLLESVFGIVPVTNVLPHATSIIEYQAHPENIHLGLTSQIVTKGDNPVPLSLIIMLTRLPAKPIEPRSADRRVGYFTSGYIALGDSTYTINGEDEQQQQQQGVTDIDVSHNKNNDFSKPPAGRDCGDLPCMALDPSTRTSLNGTTLVVGKRRLSETNVDHPVFDRWDKRQRLIHRRRIEGSGKNSIVFYVDPTVPCRWWPSIVSGVEEWNKAFINLGYSNKTIRAITPDALDEWPNDYAIGDIRYNTISMLADPSITMAIGPSVVDPRSGEILSSNIVFTSSWMRTWLKKFEMWERIIHEKSNRTGERIDGTVPSRRQDEDGVSAKQLRQLNLDGTVDVLAEELIFGTTKSQTQTRWSSLSDDDLIHEVIGRPSSFTPMTSPFEHQMDLEDSKIELVLDLVLRNYESVPYRRLGYLDHESHLLYQVMSRLIDTGVKEVTMHEVGHTLGLRHNFRASSGFPLEKRTDSSYITVHGLSPSVMDYMDLNLPLSIFQQSTSLGVDLLQRLLSHHFFTPTIGSYDFAAIGYGYSKNQSSYLDYALIADKSPGGFATDEDGVSSASVDPYNNLFDLSDPLAFSLEELESVRLFQRLLSQQISSRTIHPSKFTLFQHRLIKRVLRASIGLSKFIGGMSVFKSSNFSNSIGPLHAEKSTRQWHSLSAILDVLDDSNDIPSCRSIPSGNSSTSLFPSIASLPYMTNLESDEVNYILSSHEVTFYPRHFESLFTPIVFLKKILILSTFLPSRLSRVYHIGLSAMYPSSHPSSRTLLTLPTLFFQVGSTIFSSSAFDTSSSCSSFWDIRRFWVRLLLNFVYPKASILKLKQGQFPAPPLGIDAPIAAAALRELRRIDKMISEFVQRNNHYESIHHSTNTNHTNLENIQNVLSFVYLIQNDIQQFLQPHSSCSSSPS